MSKTVRRLTAGIAAAVMCVGMAMPVSSASGADDDYHLTPAGNICNNSYLL